MIPKKDHLQIIVKELEKFESDLDKSYNFQEFFDRCFAIFSPDAQTELRDKIIGFEKRFHIGVISAQNMLFVIRVQGRGGKRILKFTTYDGDIIKQPVNIVQLETELRTILIWCRKMIIKLIKDEQVDFKDIPAIDLKGF